ncbi:MAG: hypothetical protein QOJ03_494 [Frankiaceae bacterium]|jgi:uncharacterized protein (DUF427 family)/CBS domain-containing protein|nr:hypothetical protein [Frankiaceae bacterium]
MTKEVRVPDEDHPITIDADTDRVVVRVDDTVMADTTAALTLREAGYPPVHYIPLADVVPGTLHPSSTRSYCPYKGDASYYDVVLPDGPQIVDAAWAYATPHPAMAAIANHLAFYTDRVHVTTEPRSEHTAMDAHPTDVAELIESAAARGGMPTAAELMRAAVVSVERDAHLAAVAYLMRRAGETALVVVNDAEQRTPLAVITDTDLAQAIADGRDPNEVRVSDLVHREPIAVTPDTPLVRAAQVMVSSGIRHLPVVEQGRLLGMVDISDACRALVEMRNKPDVSVTGVAMGDLRLGLTPTGVE